MSRGHILEDCYITYISAKEIWAYLKTATLLTRAPSSKVNEENIRVARERIDAKSLRKETDDGDDDYCDRAPKGPQQ